jgi:hypothetical protein
MGRFRRGVFQATNYFLNSMPPNERKALEQKLTQQGDDIKRILFLMEGDGIGGGIVPNIQTMKVDIHALKEWRKEQEIGKGKIDLKRIGQKLGFAFTAMKWAAGLAGIPISAFTIYKWIFA